MAVLQRQYPMYRFMALVHELSDSREIRDIERGTQVFEFGPNALPVKEAMRSNCMDVFLRWVLRQVDHYVALVDAFEGRRRLVWS